MSDGAQTELVAVSGADAASYLDSQCTQDLKDLGASGPADTLVLAPTGEIVTIATVRATPTGVSLEVPVGTAVLSISRLERFAIRADVAFEGSVPLPSDVPPAFADELARVRAQVPGATELARSLVPHALDPSVRDRCVSFTKGCYPGQELVARMESRHATPPYVLRRVLLDGPAHAGDLVGDPSKDGALTSVALDRASGSWWGLCVLHRRDAEGGEVAVHASDATRARLQ